MLRFALMTLLGLITAFSAHAETVYVDDMLRVGVRTQPRSNEAPISVVTTGSKLTVLNRDRGYMQVRTEEGVEGWVNAVYVSSEPPARLRIEQLQSEYERLQGEIKELRSGGAATLEENQRLNTQVQELMAENSTMHAQLSKLYANSRQKVARWDWLYEAGAMIGLFLFGFFLGFRRYRQRVAARLGGLEI